MNATVVEKLREILLNLRVPPNYSTAIPLTSSTPLNPNSNVVYGERSLYPSEVRDSSSVVYGSQVDKHEGLLANSSSVSDSLLKHLQDLIHVLKMASAPSKNPNRPSEGAEMELNLTLEDITDLNNLMGDYHRDSVPLKHVAIIVSYLLIAFVSIVGNLLVVQLVIRSRRLHTLTHALLANLAVADLFMSTLNIPFSAARVILAEWPFGSFLCHAVPFVQVTSVYVTSITMAVIALDRYQVIMNPLGRRMKSSQGILLVLAIWSFSGLLSLPYALHHKVVTVLTVRVVNRCQAEFTSMQRRRWLTVATVFGQYFIPLGFTTASYVSIMFRLGLRSSAMGSTTPRQVAAQSKAKRKTIKMLVLTVIFFAVCWAPINAYHLLTHFSLVAHNSTAILICHLIAMSSTCYNPFIYCWLNEHFRREALKWLCCIRTRQHHRSPVGFPTTAGDTNGTLKRSERQAASALNNSNHSAVSIPLFNLRPGSAASFNQPDQLHHMKSMANNGSHGAIGLEISSSSTSSYAAAVRKKKKGKNNNDGKREKVRRHKSAGAAVSSDDSVSNVAARANSVLSCGIFNNDPNLSCSSLENCHDSGCGTAKAESPV